MNKFILIDEKDNVAVATEELHAGERLEIKGRSLTLAEEIPRGHKFAIEEIAENEKVVKYGFPIGHATTDIKKGEHVHTNNLRTDLKDNLSYTYHPISDYPSIKPQGLTIRAYKRYDGQIGIRNELWIVPTVGCVNGQAQAIIRRAKEELDLSHVDDIRVYTHNYGCSQLGDDLVNTRKALAALAKHPNAGGVLVMSLGCESNQLSGFKEEMKEWDTDRVRFLVSQQVKDEIETGFELVKELVENMKKDKREKCPVSLLKVGLKCGGSDGFSGITANPLVGRFSDWLIGQGGTTILTEVPEMFGAETILMNRAADQTVFNRIVSLINDFKDYFRKYKQPIYENPSPGNKEGGITTLEDKSLGCVQKGGHARVVDVLDYTGRVKAKGLNLLNSPGNDLVSASALALSGCQLILFTTGRGTPFGSFVPTMKISTNTGLYEFKNNWIDFNAGRLLEGTPIDTVLNDLIEKVTDTCNGTHLKHERFGFKEIAIFKSGVTL